MRRVILLAGLHPRLAEQLVARNGAQYLIVDVGHLLGNLGHREFVELDLNVSCGYEAAAAAVGGERRCRRRRREQTLDAGVTRPLLLLSLLERHVQLLDDGKCDLALGLGELRIGEHLLDELERLLTQRLAVVEVERMLGHPVAQYVEHAHRGGRDHDLRIRLLLLFAAAAVAGVCQRRVVAARRRRRAVQSTRFAREAGRVRHARAACRASVRQRELRTARGHRERRCCLQVACSIFVLKNESNNYILITFFVNFVFPFNNKKPTQYDIKNQYF